MKTAFLGLFLFTVFVAAQDPVMTREVMGLERMITHPVGDPQGLSEVDALILKAKEAIAEEAWKEAAGHLRTALKKDPAEVEVYLGFADFHLARKEYPSVEKAVLKALEVSPESAEAHFQYSRILMIKGVPAEAIKEAAKATALAEAGKWLYWAWTAKLKREQENRSGAREELEEAVKQLKFEISRIEKTITRYESQQSVSNVIEETEVINSVGGSYTEVPVQIYQMENREAPEAWHRHLRSLQEKLLSLEAELKTL